jgi:hypothetical protein
MTKEEVLSSASLLSVLPVLSPGAVENLAMDLERAVKGLGKSHDNGLRQVALAVRAFYEAENRKALKTEAELDLV